MKIAIAGMAIRSTAFLGDLKQREDCEITALCDKYPSRIKYISDKYGLEGAKRYTSFKKCIKESEFDAVMIFTSDYAHAEIVIPALKAGKYVFVEKPLDITERKCRLIIDADIEAGGKTYVGHNLRHAPVYKKIKSLIEDGVAGDLLTIQADEFYDGGRTYFRRWNRLKKFSGGLWITKSCHDFDIIQWLAGREAESVAAFSALSYYKKRDNAPEYCGECSYLPDCFDAFDEKKVPKAWLAHVNSALPDGMQRPDLCLYNSDKDTFDHGIATIKFQNGLFATYTVNVVSGFTNRRIRVSGTKATIDGDISSQEIIIRRRDPSSEEKIVLSDSSDGHGGADKFIIADFLAFARGEKSPACRPSEAIIGVRLGLAAEKSCLNNKIIKVPENLWKS
jgi:predicted dehydrogenase